MRHAGDLDSRDGATRRVLVVGYSTRAIAESAARAGFAVSSADAFGDLDNPAAPSESLYGDIGSAYGPAALVRAARSLPGDAVAYVASFENHPRAVAQVADGRILWGNPPKVLVRARNPLLLAALLRRHGFDAPLVRTRAPATRNIHWLAKPRASGGGHGIVRWRSGQRVSRGMIVQERITGLSGSIAFVADGKTAVPIAISRQLVGEPAFGATGFRYCGSILHRDIDPALLDRATAIATMLTEELGLVGVNGIDFVARRGRCFAIEVNPRYSASMELAERAVGFSVFAAHAAAFGGTRPAFDLGHALRQAPVVGKAVVYARHTVAVGDTQAWLDDDTLRDVPRPGERIARGRPVCTIFASGRTVSDCHAALVRRARKLYEELAGRRRRSA